jgi:hypothetical protein
LTVSREISIKLKRPAIVDPLPKDFVEELPEILANILDRISSGSRLSRITLDIDDTHAHLFEKAFAQLHPDVGPGLTFPTVKHLAVGPYNGFIIKRCPNVEFLSDVTYSIRMGDLTDHAMNLIKEARTADPQILKCLQLSELLALGSDLMNGASVLILNEPTFKHVLKAIYRSIPSIKILDIKYLCLSSAILSFEVCVRYYYNRYT